MHFIQFMHLQIPGCRCRQASVEMTAAGAALRTAGPALLVSGMLTQHQAKPDNPASIQGPCLLPDRPAVYTCACQCRVSLPSSHRQKSKRMYQRDLSTAHSGGTKPCADSSQRQ